MKYIYCSLLICFLSCKQKVINDSADIKKAKNLGKEFYDRIKSKDTTEIFSNLDKSVNKEYFSRGMKEYFESYGDIKEVNIYDVETERIGTGKREEINYRIYTKILHKKIKSYDLVEFVKVNDSIKLMSHYFAPPKYR